jgi:hypothetical protein
MITGLDRAIDRQVSRKIKSQEPLDVTATIVRLLAIAVSISQQRCALSADNALGFQPAIEHGHISR